MMVSLLILIIDKTNYLEMIDDAVVLDGVLCFKKEKCCGRHFKLGPFVVHPQEGAELSSDYFLREKLKLFLWQMKFDTHGDRHSCGK